jgi:4-amino-4-deoxychorismate lyase
MYLVNGEVVDHIDATDRSFQYGDGCFSTILTKYGQLQQWRFHQERIEACLNVLSIPLPDWSLVQLWIDKLCLSDAYAGIKIHISRGSGGRGYSAGGMVTPTVTISSFPYPSHYENLRQYGIELGICQNRLGLNPLLAGHKHNNRLEQILLKREMDRLGFIDGVALDLNDQVIETTMANIFWCKNGTLYTPCLTHSGVAGVQRRAILELAQSEHQRVEIGGFSLDQLCGADEVFISNSILQIAPVVRIAESRFSIGEVSRFYSERLG